MFLTKDILLIDFETTGVHPGKLEPIELGALLIDCETFEVKKEYHSLIKAQYPQYADERALEVSGNTRESIITKGISLGELVEDFENEIFLKNNLNHSQVYLSSWNIVFDIPILNRIYDSCGYATYIHGSKDQFDFHVIDLWTLMFSCAVLTGRVATDPVTGMRSELQKFGESVNYDEKHNALEDCKMEYKLLKKFWELVYPELENVSDG